MVNTAGRQRLLEGQTENGELNRFLQVRGKPRDSRVSWSLAGLESVTSSGPDYGGVFAAKEDFCGRSRIDPRTA